MQPETYWPVEHSDDFYNIEFIRYVISANLQPIDDHFIIQTMTDLLISSIPCILYYPATHWHQLKIQTTFI